jgi:hypothetical protein
MLRLSVAEGVLEVAVADAGEPAELSSRGRLDLTTGARHRATHGRGIPLIAAIAEQWGVTAQPDPEQRRRNGGQTDLVPPTRTPTLATRRLPLPQHPRRPRPGIGPPRGPPSEPDRPSRNSNPTHITIFSPRGAACAPAGVMTT